MMIDKRVLFDGKYIDEENQSTTYYFKADKSLLHELIPDKFQDAQSLIISIEFPSAYPEPKFANVCMAPIIDKDICDYWFDVDLPYDEREELLKIGELNKTTQKLDEKLELAKDTVSKLQQSTQSDLNKNICR